MASSNSSTTQAEQPETITVVGRLVADPVLRKTTNGKSVSTIRIAVIDGEDIRFKRVVVWNRSAEVMCEYITKGRAVQVDGALRERTFQPAEGDPVTYTEISARSVQFLDRIREPESPIEF